MRSIWNSLYLHWSWHTRIQKRSNENKWTLIIQHTQKQFVFDGITITWPSWFPSLFDTWFQLPWIQSIWYLIAIKFKWSLLWTACSCYTIHANASKEPLSNVWSVITRAVHNVTSEPVKYASTKPDWQSHHRHHHDHSPPPPFSCPRRCRWHGHDHRQK